MDIENVSLTEVIAAARARHASLVPESAGYLLLGVMRAVGGRPVRIVASQVMLNTEGVVTLVGPREALRASEAAAGMVKMLHDLLDVAQGKATALRAVVEAADPKMDRVFTGVTKALIPINRAAAKRALARLARETARAKARGQLRPEDLQEAPAPRPATPAPAPFASWDALKTDIDIVTPTPAPLRPRVAITAQVGRGPRETPPPAPSGGAEASPELVVDPAAVEAARLDEAETTEIDAALPVGDAISPDEGTPEERCAEGAAARGATTCDADAAFAVTPRAEDVAVGGLGGDRDGDRDAVVASAAAREGQGEARAAEEGAASLAEPEGIVEANDADDDGAGVVAAAEAAAVDIAERTVAGGTAEGPREDRDAVGSQVATDALAMAEVDASPLDAIASETALAERLMRDGRRGTGEKGRVEHLLEDFGASDGDAIEEAVEGLERLVEPTPMPGIVAAPQRRETLSIEREALRPRRALSRIVKPVRSAMTSRSRAPTLSGVAASTRQAPGGRAGTRQPISMPRRGPSSAPGCALPFAPVIETPSAGGVSLARSEAPPAVGARDDSPGPRAASREVTPEPLRGEGSVGDVMASASDAVASASDEVAAERAVTLVPPSTAGGDRISVELSDSLAPGAELSPSEACAEPGAEDGFEPEEPVPSLSPPMVAVDERPTPDEVSLAPATLPARRRRPFAVAALGLTLSLAVAATIVGSQRPELLAQVEDRVQALTQPAPAPGAGGACLAELRLKDLPRPHEVLLRLGSAPVTATLPTGVRLEIVALAPDRLPERLVIGPDAGWTDGPLGRELSLEVALEAQDAPHWPPAPPGAVGGVGPRGQVKVAAAEGEAEIWLVAGAGSEGERVIEIPCGEGATLLAVNPEDPREQRRLHIAPRLLEAAAEAGGAEISLRP